MKKLRVLIANMDRKAAKSTAHIMKLAQLEERERCAQVADLYQQRALQDGMLAPAAVGKIIAEAIRVS